MRYFRPTSLADAVAVLTEEAENARVLVGGTDLLVGVRHHTVTAGVLVDIKHITDLPAPITVDEDGVTIGPTLSMTDLAAHDRVRAWFPGLVEAALTVGSVAIRNRASLIGNSCNGSPAADTAPALLVHDVQVTITGDGGNRTVPLRDFFLGPRRTLCQPGHLVTSLRIKRPEDGTGTAFARMTRRRGVDLATVSVAVAVDAGHRVTLGMGAVGPVPLVAGPSGPVDLTSPSARMAAIEELLQASSPITDVRSSREYRQAMLRVLAQRALLRAAERRQPTARSDS